jgi:uncharacterized protein YifE (UPF0438 family)
MPILDFMTWPLDLEDSKAKFHVRPNFKFTKMVLTGAERKSLERWGTLFQAFQEDARVSSSSADYKHFMKVLENFKQNSITSAETFRAFVRTWQEKADPITNKERAWFKYQTMLKEEKRLKNEHEDSRIHSSERDEYIKSRLVP